MVNSYVDLSFEGRTLSMRQDQLTTSNVAMAFQLTAETIILVSDNGHAMLPGADGVLDADPRNSWNVQDPEGERAYLSHSLNCNTNVGGRGAFHL